eukprot:12576570-Alexandrium_andersonii.AAC.1
MVPNAPPQKLRWPDLKSSPGPRSSSSESQKRCSRVQYSRVEHTHKDARPRPHREGLGQHVQRTPECSGKIG